MTRFTRAGWMALAIAVALPLGVHGVLATAAQERMAQPQITGVSPAGTVQEKAPQTLTVTGRNFADGLALEISSPEGQMQVLSGQDIRGLRETTFQISLLINRPGTYTFTVKNSNGSVSNAFEYKVPAPAPAPSIERIEPSSVPRDTRPQRFTVVGRNFVYGLTVTLTDSAGEVSTIAKDDIGNVTETSFTVDLTLAVSGEYSVLVTNPSTAASNSVTLTATMVGGR